MFCSCNKKEKYNLSETYLSRDKISFGTSVAKNITEKYFSNTDVETVFTSFNDILLDNQDSNEMYMCISNNFFPSEDDVLRMLSFMYRGNTVFISAANYDTTLLNKLYCSVVNFNAIYNNIPAAYDTTSLFLSPLVAPDQKKYSYYFYPFSNYFSRIDLSYYREISYNASGQPNGFILFGSKGKFILHCEPRAFSNYFLLKDDNYAYLTNILNIIPPPEHIYWDNYYQTNLNKRKNASGSALNEIFKYPSLRAAFWIFLLMLLLYVLFNLKRKQRLIPVIPSNENSSVAFTETISRLYLQQKDHKGMADKMIIYFYDHIKTNYFIQKGNIVSETVVTLSRKSGVPEEKVASLFNTIETIQNSGNVSEQDLLLLNEKIQQFFKLKK